MASKKLDEKASIAQKGSYYFPNNKYNDIVVFIEEFEKERGAKFNNIIDLLEFLILSNIRQKKEIDNLENKRLIVVDALKKESQSNFNTSKKLDDYVNLFFSKEVQEFSGDVENAFKVLFDDKDFSGLTRRDLFNMMLDYCKRDPSNEFPFEPVATEIYKRIKSNDDTRTMEEKAIVADIESGNNGTEGGSEIVSE